jgi:hypothetical protein
MTEHYDGSYAILLSFLCIVGLTIWLLWFRGHPGKPREHREEAHPPREAAPFWYRGSVSPAPTRPAEGSPQHGRPPEISCREGS